MCSANTIDVSVIVPCYKAAAFVEQCLNSALSQKGVGLEVIAIDDASPDSTRHILRSMAQDHPSLTVITHPENKGQATARNTGFDSARGTYVTYLDSDDYYLHDNVLADWVGRARRDRLEMCVSDYMRLTNEGALRNPGRINLGKDEVVTAANCPQLADVSQCWQILYDRAFLLREGLRFSQELRQREDRLYFISCFLRAKRIGKSPGPKIAYRAHDESTMAQVTRDQFAQFTRHVEILAETMQAAHEATPGLRDFETANATRYWRQTFNYWDPVILTGICEVSEETGSEPTYEIAPFIDAFLDGLQALTHRADPVFSEDFSVREMPQDHARKEGTADIARIALAAGRRDLVAHLLLGRRIPAAEVIALAEGSAFAWAGAAATHYLRFSRNHQFPVYRPNKTTPRLGDLVERVILHIGMPKTGSSAMQEFLELNRIALLRRGIWYPDIGVERGAGVRQHRTSGQALLIKKMLTDRTLIGPAIAAQIRTLPHKVDTVILSAENIFSDRFLPRLNSGENQVGDLVARILESLDVPKTEIMVTLRRQDDWFASYYRELMANPFNQKTSSPRPFWEGLAAHGLFDYEAILGQIEQCPLVGARHIAAVGQVRAMGGAVSWLLPVLGIEDAAGLQTELPPVNESYNDAMAANIKLLKCFGLPRNEASDVFSSVIGNTLLADHPFRLIDADLWQEFHQTFARLLRQFDRRFPDERAVIPSQQDAGALPLDAALVSLLSEFRTESLGGDDASAAGPASLEQIRGELDYMKNSVSWRVTAPLRGVMRTYKRLRGQP